MKEIIFYNKHQNKDIKPNVINVKIYKDITEDEK